MGKGAVALTENGVLGVSPVENCQNLVVEVCVFSCISGHAKDIPFISSCIILRELGDKLGFKLPKLSLLCRRLKVVKIIARNYCNNCGYCIHGAFVAATDLRDRCSGRRSDQLQRLTSASCIRRVKEQAC